MRGYCKKLLCMASVVFSLSAIAQSQASFDLPEPYRGWEQRYLSEHPVLQKVMDAMVQTTVRQLKEPEQDILHNRICSAMVYQMANELAMSKAEQKLAVAGDLLHNIGKEENAVVLTQAQILDDANTMVMRLKQAGYFGNSPRFWSHASVLNAPKIGDNRALIHHITGALMAGKMLTAFGEFSTPEIEKVEVAILEHSTGYWYFRASIDALVGKSGAWENVYPEPENDLSKLIHDADLISQFVPESVVPEGSKWRELAKKRWGASTAQEEGHIVYYVFRRLFEEAKTDSGRRMAKAQWDVIAPELVNLMDLPVGSDPIKALGTPRVFQEK